ncbi:glycosyltransferase [uncultured Pseudokineococcus sp.]|uniref:glycosyltransferase n=1 Tax=uncultured Pseudokineococcus sp. TaxID=1642928 RepID=UPI00261CC525|nr:glycosyltransferase [uncultured Pseudokineococcus sp.]
MRVLHVNKFLHRRGGAESHVLDLAAAQRRAGHDVELWGTASPEDPPGMALADVMAPHVELEPPPPGAAARVRAAAGTVWSVRAERAMGAALQRFSPDVVHCHNIYHQLSPSVLRPVRRAGVRCVMTLHDYKLVCPSYQMLAGGSPCQGCVRPGVAGPLQALRHRCKGGSLGASAVVALESALHRALGAYDPVHAFVSPSRFLADVLSRAGVGRGRVHVVRNPAPVVPPDRLVVPGRRRDVVVACRLSPEKGVDVLLRALAGVPAAHRLHVAGDGPARAELESLAARVAPGRVVFHGRLPGEHVQALVAGAVAAVVPSRWYENAPLSVTEALAAGVPAVVTDLGGAPELVRDGVDGLVVAPERPEALAGALSRLLADPLAAGRMGALGRERVLVEHDPARHVRLLDAVYAGTARPEPVLATAGGRRG